MRFSFLQFRNKKPCWLSRQYKNLREDILGYGKSRNILISFKKIVEINIKNVLKKSVKLFFFPNGNKHEKL